MYIDVDWTVTLHNRMGDQIGPEIEVEMTVKPDGFGSYLLMELCSRETVISDPTRFDATDAEILLWDTVQKLVDTDFGLQALIVSAEQELEFEYREAAQ